MLPPFVIVISFRPEITGPVVSCTIFSFAVLVVLFPYLSTASTVISCSPCFEKSGVVNIFVVTSLASVTDTINCFRF